MKYSDLDWILPQIDTLLAYAPKLLVSHELSQISNIEERFFKILVASVISLRTKEKVTWEASKRVFSQVKDFQTLANIVPDALEKMLYPCGFYKRKTIQLKEIAKIMLASSNPLPQSIEELLLLPGVGRKVANLVVTEVFGQEGICVDIHVHRIVNRWGWVKTANADQTELRLRERLPRQYWRGLNRRLVLLGQNICLPRNPKCAECFLDKFCPKVPFVN